MEPPPVSEIVKVKHMFGSPWRPSHGEDWVRPGLWENAWGCFDMGDRVIYGQWKSVDEFTRSAHIEEPVSEFVYDWGQVFSLEAKGVIYGV